MKRPLIGAAVGIADVVQGNVLLSCAPTPGSCSLERLRILQRHSPG